MNWESYFSQMKIKNFVCTGPKINEYLLVSRSHIIPHFNWVEDYDVEVAASFKDSIDVYEHVV